MLTGRMWMLYGQAGKLQAMHAESAELLIFILKLVHLWSSLECNRSFMLTAQGDPGMIVLFRATFFARMIMPAMPSNAHLMQAESNAFLLLCRGHASEKPELPTALNENTNIRFLGPNANAMSALGDKIGSTILAQAAGVPTIPWSGSGVAISFDSCHGNIPADIYDQVGWHVCCAPFCNQQVLLPSAACLLLAP